MIYRQDIEEVISAPQPTRARFLEKAGLKQRAFFASPEMDTHAMLVEPMVSPSFAILGIQGHQKATGIMLPILNVEYFHGTKTK